MAQRPHKVSPNPIDPSDRAAALALTPVSRETAGRLDQYIGLLLEWQAKTDVNGGFEWDFAPTGSILFWFDANGYQPQRGVSLAADGSDHQITLKSDSAQ